MSFALMCFASLAWGIACGTVIKNPCVSLPVAIVGGVLIGAYWPY